MQGVRFLKAYVIYLVVSFIAAVVVGASAGGILGFIIGFVMGFEGKDQDSMVATMASLNPYFSLLGFIAALFAGFFVYRWSIRRFIVPQINAGL